MLGFLFRNLHRFAFLLPNRYFLIGYNGGKIFLNLKESPMMMMRAFSVYEYGKKRLFCSIVREGMTVIDIGANKGYFSLLFAKLMNDRGRVLSFEPDSANCYWFNKSIQANGYRCIKLFPYALSDKEGSVTFHRGKKSGWGSFFPSPYTEEKPITIKTRKLDDVLRDEGINNVDIIQMDVEGADLLVLKGAEKTLKEYDINLAMDADVQSLEEKNQLFDFLESCCFKIFTIGRVLTPIENPKDMRSKEIYAVKC